MYCSLQEAYNVPTFDAAGKKRKSCMVQAKASADAYDPYFPEAGKGETAAWKKTVENFQGTGLRQGAQENTVTYKGQSMDYDYYRKAYGISTPSMAEHFEGQQAPKPKKPQPQCNSVHPQRYEIPLSDESKAMYDSAMKTALTQETNATLAPLNEPRKVNMDGVDGYYDEDLEQYLQTKDMKAAPITIPTPIVKQELKAEPYDPDQSPFAKAMQYFQREENKTPLSREEVPKPVPTPILQNPWSNIWDILMFVFAGILIMFLCEQLFKMAMMIGMKRTVDMLEPYLLQKLD
jgi:hypothetical protein